MGIRKNQIITLSDKAIGHRLLTDAEYTEVYNRVRDRYTQGGKYPFMTDSGESVIVGRTHSEDLGGCEVKVVSGRAKWDLDYCWRTPTNLMRVAYEGHTYLVSRNAVA